MGEAPVLTVAQATEETAQQPAAPEPSAEPAEVPPGEAGRDMPTTAAPADAAPGETEPGADEGLIETIIDAVTDAVEEVVPGGEEGAAEETVAVPEDHGTAGDDHEAVGAELWLVLALVALILMAFRPAKRAMLGALDQRAGRIRDELEEAHRLREEAQAALANFQRRQRDAIGEAEEIIAHARAEAERLREHAAAELEVTLKRREAMAMDRITQAEAAATAEVRGIAVDVAVAAAREVIGDQLDKAKADALVEEAIKDLPGKLH